MEGIPEDDLRAPDGGNVYSTYKVSVHDSSRRHYGDNHYNTNHHYHATKDRSGSSKRPQDRLKEYVSHGALHNSAERGRDAPKCFPETRVAVQQEMISWTKRERRMQQTTTTVTTTQKQILWLSGPAGSGKTAIMGTIADEFHKEGLLAAGFFFSSFAGFSDRCSKRLFITTLVYQLSQHDVIKGYSDEVMTALDRDPLIFKRDLDAQIDALILVPLRNISGCSDQETWPQSLLVDGLDECAGDRGGDRLAHGVGDRSKGEVHQEILSVLVRASSDPAFPFRIIVASRPENAIEKYFSSLPPTEIKKIFLDSKYSPKADMELYTRAMLTKVGIDCSLPNNWYAEAGRALGIEDVPSYWAQEASEQFVYVATVIRYIQSGPGTPHEQLDRALHWRQSSSSKPFAALDALYSSIIQTSPKSILAAKWIRTALTYGRLGGRSWYISALLESSPGESGYLLGPLSSLIRIVNEDGDPDFHMYHKSLSDFLKDPQRSADLYIPDEQVDVFESGRYSEVLINRGPQISLPAARTLDVFLGLFFYYLTEENMFPPAHNYRHDATTVDWWLAHHHLAQDAPRGVIEAFRLVHKKCRWYSCRPACKVWRRCILRFAKENGWRVPTTLDIFRDRFKPIEEDHDDDGKVGLGEMLGPPDYTSRARTHRLRALERQRSDSVIDLRLRRTVSSL